MRSLFLLQMLIIFSISFFVPPVASTQGIIDVPDPVTANQENTPGNYCDKYGDC